MRVRVTADAPEILDRIPGLLPPGAKSCSPSTASESFGVIAEGGGTYRFERGDSPVSKGIDLGFALELLEGQIRMYVGLNAPNRIFVHAGVVAHRGAAIVMPGLSFAGKTTLVLAMVRAGATYYSDDYAVIDEAGLVHPYPKPLSVRDEEQVQTDQAVERFGGVAGAEPLRIGAVAFAEYRPGAQWQPNELSPGQGLLAMLENTLSIRARSEEAMTVLRRALSGAVILAGERGEAEKITQQLLDLVPASSI